MLLYSQSGGFFTDEKAVVLLQSCYAGNGVWKNSPVSQDVRDHGPLPQNRYTLSLLHVVPHLGPCMALTPDPKGQMFGRSGFFIHLDNPNHPGQSSDGCIVLSNDSYMTGGAKLQELEKLRASGKDQLLVVALIPDAQWPVEGHGGPISIPATAPENKTDSAPAAPDASLSSPPPA